MKTTSKRMKVSVLSLAVQGALAGMCVLPAMAQAADDKVTALTQPTNTIEVGVENVSKKSAKFGEYNGLNKSGTEFIGNFSVRGGDAYNGGTGNGTTRWGISGTDLGTTSRELGATVENQGRWQLSIGQDELRHNISDTYQTPLQGSMGGNNFTLPTSFGIINGSATNAGNGANPLDPVLGTSQAVGTRVLSATQQSLFHTEDVGTTRKNTSLNAGFAFNPQLSLKFDYNHLAQSGAKLISAANSPQTVPLPTTGTAWRAESFAILMNPTNYKTDTFNLALNWAGDKGHVNASYFASIFRDGYDRLSWNSPVSQGAAANLQTAACGVGTTSATCYYTGAMSTAPSNNFHQLNLSGGYAFSSATKLTGGYSYGRNTQNDSFIAGMPEIGALPQSSLNGLVISKHADLKLSHQASKDLALSASYKFNERDNRTSSNTYIYAAINSITVNDYAPNAPYSNKKAEIELAGTYRIDNRQSVQVAYNHDKTDRWCNNYANAAGCLIATSNTEDKLGAKYKLKAGNGVTFNAGYSVADRKGSYDFNARTPLIGRDTATPNFVNSQNYPGFVAVPYSGRKQDVLKTGINWQATEKLDVGVEGRYAKDKYDSTLGVQDVKTTGINLDATYSYTNQASVSAYASFQDNKRNNRVGAAGGGAVNTAATYAALVAPVNIFTYSLSESSDALGLVTKHSGLMGGKLELVGDLSYSFDKSGYNTQLQYVLATCSATNALSCGALPDITSRLTTFKLTGTYSIDKASKVAVAYAYQNRKTNDYYYNTTQMGFNLARGLPTNEQAPNYSVNVFGVSYIYSFK
ncbi:MAG: MtrB/PioB family decaheme-associated outer membrane protein [Sulfuritalea sp.]|nr:MtrB/PioB family decaheme-associated outer membrane protein [Sulfuritalea sp.]